MQKINPNQIAKTEISSAIDLEDNIIDTPQVKTIRKKSIKFNQFYIIYSLIGILIITNIIFAYKYNQLNKEITIYKSKYQSLNKNIDKTNETINKLYNDKNNDYSTYNSKFSTIESEIKELKTGIKNLQDGTNYPSWYLFP